MSQLPFYQLLRQGKFDSVSAELNSTLNTSVWVHLLPEMEFTIPTVVQDGEVSSTPKDDRGLVIVKLAIVCMAGQGMCMWKLCIFRLGALNGGIKINDDREKSGRRRK